MDYKTVFFYILFLSAVYCMFDNDKCSRKFFVVEQIHTLWNGDTVVNLIRLIIFKNKAFIDCFSPNIYNLASNCICKPLPGWTPKLEYSKSTYLRVKNTQTYRVGCSTAMARNWAERFSLCQNQGGILAGILAPRKSL